MRMLEAMVGTGLCFIALGYSLLVVLAIYRRPRSAAASGTQAPVTILKPLCGCEARLYESVRSFCMLDYPRYQIVFGAADRHDPAVQIVETLRREFPHLDITLAIGAARRGSNPKVNNLLSMLPMARYEYLVIADSDISVKPDYLSRLAPHLDDPAVGIVTCAYLGRPVSGLWSRVGAEFINGWFIPSVFVASLLKSREFAFGATIALRRQVLQAIGGFAAIADQLADDYRLGELTRRLGLATVLSEVVVETTVREQELADLIHHQLRWLRTIRSVRPLGYALGGATFSVPLAIIGCLLAHGSAVATGLLVCAAALRSLQFVVWPRGRRDVRGLPLALLADCALFALWCVSFLSRRVRWRNATFEVQPDGSVMPVTPALVVAPALKTDHPRTATFTAAETRADTA